ncbi:MAG: extracellular solute-binding protein [Chloroflexota bacterium]|nr:extracellular solute-binding protein [Chloroflexota bacterium]
METVTRWGTRRGLLAGSGSLVVGALAGCGAPAGEDTQPAAVKGPVTVRVTARQAQEADMWPVRLPAFNAAHPNVKAEPDLHTGDIIQKTAALIASGELGDVAHTHFSNAQPQRLWLGKAMRDLDSLAGRDKLDLKQWYPQAIDASKLDGKLIALPFKGKMAATVIFVNQTLFEQGGLKVPDLNTTLNELTESATRLTKADGSQWGFAGTLPKSNTALAGAVRRHNAEVLSQDTKRAMLDTAEARAAFGWWYEAFHKRKLTDPAGNAVELFSQGKAAVLIGQDVSQQKSRIHPAALANGFTYTATLVSKGPTGRRGGSWVPDALQLSAASPNPDAAWLLLKWLTDKETGIALAGQRSSGVSNTAGARPDVYNDPRFLNHDVFPRILQELDRDSNVLPEPFQLPANYKIPEFDAVLGTYVDQIWKNQAEPTPSFMKALNDELQNVLSLPMG